ncbi:hypothetical protein [Zoogloea sp.]|uniref:hypothetical protein n=1 Tax=Zoogloea sp. TaxID=49181 RepID=UPI001415BBF8|nr:MAG: hypothetical protein F9K15_12770 [Zoogloea sp.]
MITPDQVSEAVASKLIEHKQTVGVTDAASLSEDTDAKPLRPPYIGVIVDFEEESSAETGDNVLMDVPVEVKVLCASAENKSAALSFQQAWAMAEKSIALLKGVLSVEDEEVDLMLRRRPVTILRNSAEQCVIQVNLYFNINAVGGE